MATCKYCGEPIEFVETVKGKRMPVDPESLGTHQLVAGVTVVTEGGVVLRGEHHPGVSAVGYTPHWATCPHAAQARRR